MPIDIRRTRMDEILALTDLSDVTITTPTAGDILTYDSVSAEWINAAPYLVEPVEEAYDPTGGLPEDPEVGDRYIADGTAGGWTDGYIYEWDGDEWLEFEPEEGWMVWLLFELVMWVFFSGGWMEMGVYTYLMLDGSNASQDIDIASYNFTTAGTGTFTTGVSAGYALIDNIFINANTITSDNGAISLNDENLYTSGVIFAGTINVNESILGMDANTVGHEGVSLYHDGTEGWLSCVDAGWAWHDLTIRAQNIRFDIAAGTDEVVLSGTQAVFDVDVVLKTGKKIIYDG